MRKQIMFFIILGLCCACVGQKESFTVTDIIFCTSEPSDRSYQQKTDAVYQQGEIVWIYVEAYRFDYREELPEYVAEFTAVLEVLDDQGICVHRGSQQIEIPFETEPVYAWLTFWIDSGLFEPGDYTMRITLTDALSKKSTVSEAAFHIE